MIGKGKTKGKIFEFVSSAIIVWIYNGERLEGEDEKEKRESMGVKAAIQLQLTMFSG